MWEMEKRGRCVGIGRYQIWGFKYLTTTPAPPHHPSHPTPCARRCSARRRGYLLLPPSPHSPPPPSLHLQARQAERRPPVCAAPPPIVSLFLPLPPTPYSCRCVRRSATSSRTCTSSPPNTPFPPFSFSRVLAGASGGTPRQVAPAPLIPNHLSFPYLPPQVRQAERRVKSHLQHEDLRQQHENLKQQLKDATLKLQQREAYFHNFTTQVWGAGCLEWVSGAIKQVWGRSAWIWFLAPSNKGVGGRNVSPGHPSLRCRRGAWNVFLAPSLACGGGRAPGSRHSGGGGGGGQDLSLRFRRGAW